MTLEMLGGGYQVEQAERRAGLLPQRRGAGGDAGKRPQNLGAKWVAMRGEKTLGIDGRPPMPCRDRINLPKSADRPLDRVAQSSEQVNRTIREHR